VVISLDAENILLEIQLQKPNQKFKNTLKIKKN
jgi:hypothetical protein